MKSLVDYINEGNISNTERKYREFCQMCAGYNIDLDSVTVKKTSNALANILQFFGGSRGLIYPAPPVWMDMRGRNHEKSSIKTNS